MLVTIIVVALLCLVSLRNDVLIVEPCVPLLMLLKPRIGLKKRFVIFLCGTTKSGPVRDICELAWDGKHCLMIHLLATAA